MSIHDTPTQQVAPASGLHPSNAEGSGACGWPRPVYQRRWFAWRPVRLNGQGDGWVWLRTVMKTRLTYKAGDYLFEGNVYALLP
jgi:hypothetical protein